ncbi:MAG: hypothetical protein AAF138_02030 [Planctomycetota bacterium]
MTGETPVSIQPAARPRRRLALLGLARDHRGRPCRVRAGGPIIRNGRQRDAQGRRKVMAAPIWRWEVAVATLPFVFVGLAILSGRVPGLSLSMPVRVPFQIAVTLLGVFGLQALFASLAAYFGLLRRYEAVFVEKRAEAGDCGACGYSLAEIPVQSDGCKVCPECGAAWKAGGINA